MRISDIFPSGESESQPLLRELRLRSEPSLLLLFDGDLEPAKVHYEEDEAVRSYVPCPGEGCPLCHLGQAPLLVYLLPVFNVETRQVEVLRISGLVAPGSLLAQLKPFLQDPDIANKLLALGRDRNHYFIRARPLPSNIDRGIAPILAFQDRRAAGLKLLSAFASMTAKELSEVERIRRKLDALGDYPADSTNEPLPA